MLRPLLPTGLVRNENYRLSPLLSSSKVITLPSIIAALPRPPLNKVVGLPMSPRKGDIKPNDAYAAGTLEDLD